jgi:hypothetical protein
MKIIIMITILCMCGLSTIAQSTLILPGASTQNMTTAQRVALTNSQQGTLVYDTDTQGFWYWKGAEWVPLSNGVSAGVGWQLNGNNLTNTNSGTVGVGTTSNNFSKLTVQTDASNPFGITHTNGSVNLTSEISSNGQVWLGVRTANPLHLHTDNGSGAKLSLFPNGHVGLNYNSFTAPPSALDVLAKPEYAARFRGLNPYITFHTYDPGSSDSEQFGFMRAWTEHGNVTGLFGLEIGASPRGTLNVAKHLVFSTNYARRMLIAENGNINIGVGTNPTAKLTIQGASANNGSNTVDISNTTLGPHGSHIHWGISGDWYIRSANDNGKVIIQDVAGGHVGIGTSTPDPAYRLSVNGTIRAKEVIVETNWADFVFDDGYPLRSLASVEQFIKTHKHLPDLPSAADIQQNGAKVAELATKMMQKIEELTLYSIAQEKRILQLEQQLTTIKTRSRK